MSVNIVDKRKVNRDRNVENRQRFLKRIKATVKEQLPKILGDRKLKDIDKAGGKIKVSRKTITEPFIHHDEGGVIDRVLPGNKDFVEGDLVPKPKGGRGTGNGPGGGPGDQTEDDFIVELSRDEFLDFFFEDLELPDLVKTDLSKLKETKRFNAGFQPDGSPNRLNLVRSYKQSLGRRITLKGGLTRRIEEVEEQLEECTEDQKVDLLAKIENLELKKEKIPFFEEMDLRYRLTLKKNVPVTHATMVMIMDNSGSMGVKEKTIARKFFWLLYSFLIRQYQEVDMVFVSHTDIAEEMNEHDFFNTRVSGGTIVSSALDLTSQIIAERLKGKTNIYVAQVSDGDNYDTDNGTCSEILEDDILPFVRYFAYVQVDSYHYGTSTMNGLLRTYNNVSSKNSKLQVKRVNDERDIYGVFRELFVKKGNTK